jgi:hypothetical protein
VTTPPAETYRLSQDLDFSLLPESPYTEDGIRGVLEEILSTAHEHSGIEVPLELVDVRPRRNKQAQPREGPPRSLC